MTLVIDSSVAAKWFLDEPDMDAARRLVTSGERLIAPEFLRVELANVLWKAWRRTGRGEDQWLRVEPILAAAGVELVPDRTLLADAFELAVRLRHPVYDCLYLALAERGDAQCVTNDRRLVDVGRQAGYGRRVLMLGTLP